MDQDQETTPFFFRGVLTRPGTEVVLRQDEKGGPVMLALVRPAVPEDHAVPMLPDEPSDISGVRRYRALDVKGAEFLVTEVRMSPEAADGLWKVTGIWRREAGHAG